MQGRLPCAVSSIAQPATRAHEGVVCPGAPTPTGRADCPEGSASDAASGLMNSGASGSSAPTRSLGGRDMTQAAAATPTTTPTATRMAVVVWCSRMSASRSRRSWSVLLPEFMAAVYQGAPSVRQSRKICSGCTVRIRKPSMSGFLCLGFKLRASMSEPPVSVRRGAHSRPDRTRRAAISRLACDRACCRRGHTPGWAPASGLPPRSCRWFQS